MSEEAIVTCARCGTPIECHPGADCWCAELAFRPIPENASRCLCRTCLEADRPPRELGRRPSDQ